MTAVTSPHSIDVGPRLRNGFREVTLYNRGRAVFAVTHREVQWAFLAYFQAPGEKPAHDNDGWETDAENLLYEAVPLGEARSARHTPREYLCVFHREEVKDKCGRYVVSQPTTFCAAYAVGDARKTELALFGVTATSITPGRSGVFVHGYRQYARGSSLNTPGSVELDGVVYEAATDVFWMASPLVMKPLYLRGRRMASCVGDGEGVPEWIPCSPTSAGPQSGCTDALEGGDASAWHTAGRSALNAEILFHFSPCGDGTESACAGPSSTFAVVRLGPTALGLGRLRPLSGLDAMTFEWLPPIVDIPGLAPSSSALSFTVSEHVAMHEQQALFLYDSCLRRVHILQLSGLAAPSVSPEKMVLLYTMENADTPLVLPCLRPSSPQPVLICNFPQRMEVTLLSPWALSFASRETALKESVIAQRRLVPSDHYTQASSARQADYNRTLMGDGTSSRGTSGRIAGVKFQDGTLVAFLHASDAGSTDCAQDSHLHEEQIDFPSFRSGQDIYVSLVLETVEAVLGPQVAYRLEQAVLKKAWGQADVHGETTAFEAGAALTELLLQGVQGAVISHGKSVTRIRKNSGATNVTAPSPDRLFFALKNPLLLTKDDVDALFSDTHASPSSDSAQNDGCVLSLEEGALTVVALHLLCESCRLQGKLLPVAEKLAPLVCSLSAYFGWESYVAYYDPFCDTKHLADTTGSQCRTSLRDVVPPSLAKSFFTTLLKEDGQDPEVLTGGKDTSGMEEGADEFFSSHSPSHHQPSAVTLANGTMARDPRGLLPDRPPDLYGVLQAILQGASQRVSPLCDKTRAHPANSWPILVRPLPPQHPITVANDVIRLLATAVVGEVSGTNHGNTTKVSLTLPGLSDPEESGDRPASIPWWYRVCTALLSSEGISPIATTALHTDLTIGAVYPILCALSVGREKLDAVLAQGVGGQQDAFAVVVGRLDRVRLPSVVAALADAGRDVVRLAEERAVGRQYQATLSDDDGVMVPLDFPHVWRDSRLDMAQVYFNTSRPIHIPSRAGGEQPADLLKGLALAACAMPLGRGMLTMSTHNFKVRDSTPIPRLNLDGRTGDGVFVANTGKAFQEDHLMWPLFHNGCAAGLRFLPIKKHSEESVLDPETAASEALSTATMSGTSTQGNTITRHWVVYQTKHVLSPPARAGLLLAAGILGHLTVLQLTDIYSLLVSPRVRYSGREATTMSVMLGLSCSFRGTSNDLVFRCLSMHVRSLTPSAEELDVSLDVQTCALVSIGLLCQQSSTNGFLVDMFLMEMSRLPSDEHCVHREGYALGAGFGLGMLLLGLGGNHGLPHVEDRLFGFLNGERRDTVEAVRDGGLETFEERTNDVTGHFLTHALLMQSRKTASRTPCTRVFEGEYYNTAVSGPAAAVALGLMYLKSDNREVAAKLMPPNRLSGLQGISPLLCLLRTCFAALACWSDMYPSHAFLHDTCVPAVLRELTRDKGLAQQQLHYLMMNHGHCIAGAVLALGFRFAGSMDVQLRDLMLTELHGFIKGRLGATGQTVPTLQRSTGAYDMCISTCCVAIGLVMAGTGDLKAFASLRRLQQRPNLSFSMHTALSMSIGLLFLGGGRLSLSTSTESVAALVLAFYPVWPQDPENNVHHLQILRHLYGLAVVPRVLQTVDAVSHQSVRVPVRIILKKRSNPMSLGKMNVGEASAVRVCEQQGPRVLCTETPCLYPPPESIDRIELCSTQHYHRTLLNRDGHGATRIREDGLVLRVLAIPGDSTAVTADRAAGAGVLVESRWNCVEQGLVDDVRGLFAASGVTTLASLVLLDNVKLLAASQKCVGNLSRDSAQAKEPVMVAPAGTVSTDTCRAVLRSLERQYRRVFMHSNVVAAREEDAHPFHRVILGQESWRAVVNSIVAHPEGTPGFPLDFTSFCAHHAASGGDRHSERGSSGHTEQQEQHQPPGGTVSREAVARWLGEAVQFYFGSPAQFQRVCDAIRAAAPQLKQKSTRTLTLLKVNRELKLPIDVLQHLVVCTFGIAT